MLKSADDPTKSYRLTPPKGLWRNFSMTLSMIRRYSASLLPDLPGSPHLPRAARGTPLPRRSLAQGTLPTWEKCPPVSDLQQRAKQWSRAIACTRRLKAK